MSALRLLLHQPTRLFMTVSGIALCVVLILFLFAVYQGVKHGSVEYIRANDADLWVLQPHSTNILRGSSLLVSGHGYVLNEISGVREASPVLFVLATVTARGGETATVYLTGYDEQSTRGGPPVLARGRTVKADDEIVLDTAFAAKHGIEVGNQIIVTDKTLRVVGLSKGTNMFVIQYAFVTLRTAQLVAGLPMMVSCYQVAVDDDSTPPAVAAAIRTEFPDIAVFDRSEFLQNNIREMENGILPLLLVVALLGAAVLTAILSLILSIGVLEQRTIFAVLKALGAPDGFIPGIVIRQSMILVGAGILMAFGIFHPLQTVIRIAAPEVTVVVVPVHVVAIVAGVALIGLAGSLVPIRRLRRIHPLEAFP